MGYEQRIEHDRADIRKQIAARPRPVPPAAANCHETMPLDLIGHPESQERWQAGVKAREADCRADAAQARTQYEEASRRHDEEGARMETEEMKGPTKDAAEHRSRDYWGNMGFSLLMALGTGVCSIVLGWFLHSLRAIPGGVAALRGRS